MKKLLKPKRKRAAVPATHSLPFSYETKLAETDKLLRRIKADFRSLYFMQEYTNQIVAKLQSLAPHLPLNDWFMEIVRQGTGRDFTLEDNRNWVTITRPMLEAFFHARYFLEMACKFGKELKTPPEVMPSGWAALLYLYNIR
jgi:hypothetical protein